MRLQLNKLSGTAAFTVAEMVVCFAIMALVVGGTLTAYTNSAKFAEHAGYELAAQGQAVQMVERARAALWDTQTIPITDLVPTNASNVAILELPITGTNALYCTNVMTVTTTTNSNPTWYFKTIVVTTTWSWNNTVCSNQMIVYRAPDQ